jgi:hypothetical protein
MHKEEECEGVGARVNNSNTNSQVIQEANTTIDNGKRVTVDTALKALIQDGGAMFD